MERIEKWNKGWKAGLRVPEKRSKSKERLGTRRVVEKEAKCTMSKTRQGSGKAGRTGSGGKKRKETECHEEERTIKKGRIGEKADELENYRNDIEVGNGIGEEQEESRPTVEAKKTCERENDKEGNDRSEVGLAGDGFRADKDREHEKRIDNSGSYQDERTKQVKEVENISETESESSSSSSSSSSDSISVVTGKVDSLRARAYRILERGAMPLCPRAKRDWNSVRQVDLELNNQHLLWPPTNRRALTPDQKLMAHEYVADLLENRSSKEFPVISRKTLLDKYAFFTLDGERKPQEEDDEGDKIEAKIRQCNFC